eukprot:12381897-Ditylum_brightwellii.AAC.1
MAGRYTEDVDPFALVKVNTMLKSVYCGWKNKPAGKLDPIKPMKEIFDSAPDPPMYRYFCLILEDFLLLKPGNEVLCCIKQFRLQLLNNKSPMHKNVKGSTQKEPLHPRQIADQVYFCVRLVVKLHPMQEEFENAVILKN